MTTWTFKGSIAAIALLTLSACEGGQGASLFDQVGSTSNGLRGSKPLSQTKLASGDITLVAPRGFCIDSKSVRTHFAVMARCDALGVPKAAADAPLAFITVSVHDAAPDAAPPAVEHLAAAHELRDISNPQVEGDQLSFRANGTPPIDGVSATHWRGSTRKGGQIVGVALYGPEGGRALSGEGRRIVSAVMSNVQAGS